MQNKILLTMAFVAMLSMGPISPAHAQLPIVSGLLQGGDLLGGNTNSGLPLVGGLIGGLDGLLDGGNGNLLILNDLGGGELLPIAGLTGKAGLLTTELQQILVNPLAQIPTGIDSKLIFGLVPGLEVLYTNPIGIIDFLLSGNSFTESLFILPSIPLITTGLELDFLALGELDGILNLGSSELPLLSPAELLPQILIPITSIAN